LTKKILYNKSYGGFGFSDEFFRHLDELYKYLGVRELTSREKTDFQADMSNRTNSMVFDIIDSIGLEKASGLSCELTFKEIHEDEIYEIEESNGKEELKFICMAKNNLVY
jgi:hypothetical protein